MLQVASSLKCGFLYDGELSPICGFLDSELAKKRDDDDNIFVCVCVCVCVCV